MVVTDNDPVSTTAQIRQIESDGKHPVRLYIVNTTGCLPGSELESVAQATGGQCMPMNSPTTLTSVQSLINPKVETHSIPNHRLDWPWLGVAVGGLAIDAIGFAIRQQGILPTGASPTGL